MKTTWKWRLHGSRARSTFVLSTHPKVCSTIARHKLASNSIVVVYSGKSKENSRSAPQLDVHNLGVEVNPRLWYSTAMQGLEKRIMDAKQSNISSALDGYKNWKNLKNSFWKMAPLSNETLLHSLTRSLLWWLCVLLWRTRHRKCWLWHLESYGFLQGLWLGGPCGFTGEQGVRQHCFLSSEEHAKDVLLMMPALQRPISTDCPTGLSQVMARNWSLFISWCLQDSSLQQHSI